MGQGNRRIRGTRRTKRLSPLDIIADIDAPANAQAGREPYSRHSPSRVISGSLKAGTTPAERLNRDVADGITWHNRRQHRSRAAESDSARIPMPTLPATQAFWTIWAEHQEYLRRHSLRWMSNNADDADDALSNAMLLAQRKFPKYAHAISNTRYWLTRLVHNVCMDHHRAASRLQGIESEARWDELERHARFTDRQAVRQPDQEAVNEELLINLQSALQNLPPSLREPLTLRCLYGLPYPDIAARMNLSECAVRKRVQLARDKLGHCIEVS